MKVQFLYDDAEHARPLLDAIDVFAGEEIELRPELTQSPESAMCLVPNDTDALLIHQTLMSDDALDQGVPVVILERIDGAQLAASRKWLASVSPKGDPQPSAARVLKGYSYRDPGLHNTHRGRWHAHLLRNAGVAAHDGRSCAIDGLPSPQLSTADLRKIDLGYGFGAYAKMIEPRSQWVDVSADRSVAVHCVCYVDYHGSEIEGHRRAAVVAVEQWAAVHPDQNVVIGTGRKLSHHEYLYQMFLSKIVVSPWGWGEACHRDYEAWLLGAVLIKPLMEHVASWPDLYVPDKTYVPCRPDFADLGEVIDTVLVQWPKWQRRRTKAKQLAAEAGEPRRIARRFADVFREVVE